jgi:4-hydroxy-3-methylbut-2-enyl diphosphate reductase
VTVERSFENVVGLGISDIRRAARDRQPARQELSHHMKVIPGVAAANSSNSNRLREIGAAAGIAPMPLSKGPALRRNACWTYKQVPLSVGLPRELSMA